VSSAGTGAAGASNSPAAPLAGSAAPAADGGQPPMAAPCDPSLKTPEPTKVAYKGTDSVLFEGSADTPTTGVHTVTIETDATLPNYTIYRPDFGDQLLPIVAWAEGGCLKDGLFFGEFLMEIASHGFLIIADGAPNGMEPGAGLMADSGPQLRAIDWAMAENERPCSQYYHQLDTHKIAVMGQSCGGLMSLAAATDSRISTVVLWNSGSFQRDDALYGKLHAPLAIFNGGPSDPAYAYGRADFDAINTIPILFANDMRGHGGTFWQDNGGESARVGIAWLNWQLYGETSRNAKGQFVGTDCGLCKNTLWSEVESKMLQ
jgi:Chlorophyllase